MPAVFFTPTVDSATPKTTEPFAGTPKGRTGSNFAVPTSSDDFTSVRSCGEALTMVIFDFSSGASGGCLFTGAVCGGEIVGPTMGGRPSEPSRPMTVTP